MLPLFDDRPCFNREGFAARLASLANGKSLWVRVREPLTPQQAALLTPFRTIVLLHERKHTAFGTHAATLLHHNHHQIREEYTDPEKVDSNTLRNVLGDGA